TSAQSNRSFDIGAIYLTNTTTNLDHQEIGSHVIVEDDSPSVSIGASSDVAALMTTHDALTIGAGSDTASADFGALVTTSATYGADGSGTTTTTYALALTTPGEDSGLDSDGASVLLYSIAGVVTGSTSATLGGVDAGNTIFSLSVNSGTGVVTLT